MIADETTRLAALVGDVLDTSRIEAGTFGYRFDDVDLAEVLRDSVAAAEIGQDEVRLTAELPAALPKRARRRRAAASARRQPDLERDQVLRLGRRGHGGGGRRRRTRRSSTSATRGLGSAWSTRLRSSRSSVVSPALRSPGPASGSSSRVPSPRRTAARSTSSRRPAKAPSSRCACRRASRGA